MRPTRNGGGDGWDRYRDPTGDARIYVYYRRRPDRLTPRGLETCVLDDRARTEERIWSVRTVHTGTDSRQFVYTSRSKCFYGFSYPIYCVQNRTAGTDRGPASLTRSIVSQCFIESTLKVAPDRVRSIQRTSLPVASRVRSGRINALLCKCQNREIQTISFQL